MMGFALAIHYHHVQLTYSIQPPNMENTTPPKKTTRRRRKATPKSTLVDKAINDATSGLEETVVEAPTPTTEPSSELNPTPAPESTPTPTPAPEPAPSPALVKPWEIVRPMKPPSGGWQRGQKWRS